MILVNVEIIEIDFLFNIDFTILRANRVSGNRYNTQRAMGTFLINFTINAGHPTVVGEDW